MSDPYPGHGSPSLSSENQEMVIESIRAMDVALGLRRLPASFYTVVHHSSLEWRTENKRSSVNDDVVKWGKLAIPIPSDLSVTICLEIYASFELQPMLGAGEQLRKLTVTVEQMLDRSTRDISFTFFPKDGDVVSPCSSILVVAKPSKCKRSDSSAQCALGPHRPSTESRSELELATDHGHSALARYQRHGGKLDLERSVKEFERVLSICPLDHPCRAAAQSNLAMAKFIYCQVEHTDASLEDAFSLYHSALTARPVGHADRPSTLVQLVVVQFARSGRRMDEAKEARAEAFLYEATRLGSADSHENRAAALILQWHTGRRASSVQTDGRLSVQHHPMLHATDRDLSVLSLQLLHRFERFGDPMDLQQAIMILEKMARSTSPWDDQYLATLANLGVALSHRFKHFGEPRDLEDAILTFNNVMDLTPHGHPDRPACLCNLGYSLFTRFNRFGQLCDMEDAILTLRNAVDLAPGGHHNESDLLNNLGTCLKARFYRLGELSDLEEAVSMFRKAVDLAPHDHPHKPGYLSNLGNSFFTRFECSGVPSDIDDAISTLKNTVGLAPHGHPDKPAYLTNLGNSSLARFERLREPGDLQDAISILRDAVDLTPHGHPEKPIRLNNLSNTLITRFEHLRDFADMEDAISVLSDAVNLTPDGHPDKPLFLSNLGNSLGIRFERIGMLSDLEDAVSRLRDAVGLIPHEHPYKPVCLNCLGISLEVRFKSLGELGHLEEAISALRDAIDLSPHNHPRKPTFLNNLGSCFFTRFKHLRELNDLENAISRLKDAVDLSPRGHPDKLARLFNLGNAIFMRFERLGGLHDLGQAISLFSHAASAPIGPIIVRFGASRRWISCARSTCHYSLLHAYSVAINLLPRLAWVGLPLIHRYSELRQGAGLVREAAAAALDWGLPETALQWLEQGRSIVWGELFQLRSSHEALMSTHPDHARRLRELSAALERASTVREQSLSAVLEGIQGTVQRTPESLEKEADRHRQLAIERDKLLQEIRGLPGFEQFLLHKDFSQLRASGHSGPVVILNAAESRCDALIVLANVDHVVHVPLPSFPFQRATGLQNMLEKLLGHARVVHFGERTGKSATRGSIGWEPLLSTLWNSVVKPVLDALAFSTPDDISRIFWCPTGPFAFLPIHAAGLYGTQHSGPGHKISDFVVSSYTPTLAVLAPTPYPTAVPSGNLRLLAIRQPPSDGLSRLPGVDTELECIRDVIRYSPLAHTTFFETSTGTVEEVLDLMKEADWVHFACHGIQDTVIPTESGLCLADRRRLKLRDIIAVSRPHGGLAFLSACQTAMGDERLSDEAIHIAAGMLFAGYGGVVGTMWSISDRIAPRVARDVYGQLFQHGTRPDYREAAQALHEATRRLRDSGASFVEWVPFIHVGL